MYGLLMNLGRCPDGVGLVELELPPPSDYERKHHSGEPWPSPATVFGYRSERRVAYAKSIDNLESPVVIDFVNAVDDEQRMLFFGKFGFGVTEGDLGRDLFLWHYRTRDRPGNSFFPYCGVLNRDNVIEHQARYRELLRITSGEDRLAAMDAINSIIDDERDTLTPLFHLAGSKGTPRLLLKCNSLLGFMHMEVATIVAMGARSAECEQCGTMFVTGPATGRRSHARFCSDKCRVAAMRARNAVNP
jgi:hypothetical protein